MIRKSKRTDLVPKLVTATPERLPVMRDSWDWFQEMDRWFTDRRTEFEHGLWDPAGTLGLDRGLAVRRPPINLSDNGREYVLTAKLPGVSKENVDIRVTPEDVEIAAEAWRENEETEEDRTCRERVVQSFRRSLSLPEPVLAEQAIANLKDGILELRLPKKAASPERHPVQVRVE